jgi:hypothetical protein
MNDRERGLASRSQRLDAEVEAGAMTELMVSDEHSGTPVGDLHVCAWNRRDTRRASGDFAEIAEKSR